MSTSAHGGCRPARRQARAVVRRVPLAGLLLAAACATAEPTGPSGVGRGRPNAGPVVPGDSPVGRASLPLGGADRVLTNGADHTGRVATAGQVDAWTFTAAQDARVSVRLVCLSGTFMPDFEVVGPTGTVVARGRGPRGAAPADFDAPAAGTYVIVVGDGSDHRTGTGDYGLTARWD